jgi:predicted metal-dependent phosphoesterase TrpH
MAADSMSVDLANLYREESYTDLQSASVRVLIPVLPDGSSDTSRAAMYIGDITLMTQMGPIPVQFPLEAESLDKAFALFPEGVRGAIERLNERAREMADGLAKVGIHGAYEGALKFAGNPELISRTHFARFMVESGVCQDTSEVFRRFLTDHKPGFVPHRWAHLRDAVQWITQAQGVAVIAHPARYGFTPNEEFALFTEFKNHGGQAVEVVTGSHSAAEAQRYAATALEFGLAASRGSDFHSPDESHTDLGTLPFLPGALLRSLAGMYRQGSSLRKGQLWKP